MSGDDIRMAQRAMKDAKYQKKAAIKTSRGTVSKLYKSICDSRKLQYPLLNCESEKFKNNLFLTSPKQICYKMILGFLCDIIKMMIISHQLRDTRTACIYIHFI